MDKLKMQTVNKADENYKKLAEMFPNAVTEAIDENGEVVRAIDKDVLMQEINTRVVDGKEERYSMIFPDKRKSIVNANAPISATLRPCREKSVDFDNTGNIYIEGDNLDVLKLLQEPYLNKIDVVYIDPPYNTGNDILYKNNYEITQDEFGSLYELDENGNRIYTNSDSNGRFHTDWMNMMYQRIRLARDILKESGFFLVAIDHNELFNLGEMCDEVFGYSNRIGIISVVHKPEGRNQAKFIGPSNEFMLIYAKNEQIAKLQKVVLDEEQSKAFSCADDKGAYRLKNFIRLSDGKYATRENKPTFWYPIFVSDNLETLSTKEFENSTAVYPVTTQGVERTWKTTKETFLQRYKEGNIIAKKEEGRIVIYEKLREDQVIKTHWIDKKYHGFHFGTKILDDLLGVKTFDFPKSLYLMRDIFKLFTPKDGLVFDFFSGSATSAHAIMMLNAEDGGTRKYILAQIPASCDSKSETYKAGYKNICQIGEERIRRAGKKIVEDLSNCGKERQIEGMTLLSAGVAPSSRHAEWIDNTTGEIKAESRNAHAPEDYYKYNPEKLDIGFRVLKCDSSNMKEVYYTPDDYEMSLFDSLEDNIKEDRTPEDLLFQVMLDLGILLSSKIEETTISGKKVFKVNGNYLIACFDENVTENVITEIAKQKPYYFVMRDSSMANDSVATNFDQIFASYSPSTIRKVL